MWEPCDFICQGFRPVQFIKDRLFLWRVNLLELSILSVKIGYFHKFSSLGRCWPALEGQTPLHGTSCPTVQQLGQKYTFYFCQNHNMYTWAIFGSFTCQGPEQQEHQQKTWLTNAARFSLECNNKSRICNFPQKSHSWSSSSLCLTKVGILCKAQINSFLVNNLQRTLPFPVKGNPILYPLRLLWYLQPFTYAVSCSFILH